MPADIDFRIIIDGINKGLAPLAHIDTETYIGDVGHASEMKADIISLPGFLTQSPALVDLTNGDQEGAVSELIRFILEQPTNAAGTLTYAIGATKLFELNATTVIEGGDPVWPQAVTNMTEGESLVRLSNKLYGFFNKAAGGDILQMDLTTKIIDHTWGSVADAALEKAPHPVAVKEDVMVFGNGQYLGVYIEGLATLNVQQLDFGSGAEVADVLFHSNYWWIAVNYGDRKSQMFMYDGSALSNILLDETGMGMQKIGFLYVYNGVIYVTYTDTTSGGYTIGYLSGRVIKSLRYFSGSLPTHRQKTLYKNTIIFISSTDVWSFGASVEQLPAQISKLADGGHATVGGLAAPFGTPLVASSDGGDNHRLAKFSGYSTDSEWKSLFIDISTDRRLGKIHTVIVSTKPLVGDAKATIQIEGNQGQEAAKPTTALEIAGVNKTRHLFRSIGLPSVEDVRVLLSYSTGDATDTCPIRKVVLLGNFIEN